MQPEKSYFLNWLRRFLKLLMMMLPVYFIVRLVWDWRKVVNADHPWPVAEGILLQGLFFVICFSVIGTVTVSRNEKKRYKF